ncbi:MAG: hypothetical protein Q7I97_01800, partial [Thermovirgaceae bacterium]|nr:hypothetical protein [Thermovirgaceae bacterium]
MSSRGAIAIEGSGYRTIDSSLCFAPLGMTSFALKMILSPDLATASCPPVGGSAISCLLSLRHPGVSTDSENVMGKAVIWDSENVIPLRAFHP